MASYIYKLPWFSEMERAEGPSKGVLTTLVTAISRTISMIISLVVPICMLIFGGVYFSDCPQEKYIPIYLLVGGVVKIFVRLLTFANKYRKSNNEDGGTESHLITLINIFLFVWFILGSVLIYKVYEPNYDPKLGPYCNKNLYLFAFWLTTAGWIIMAFLIIILCGIITVLACKECRKRHTTRITHNRFENV